MESFHARTHVPISCAPLLGSAFVSHRRRAGPTRGVPARTAAHLWPGVFVFSSAMPILSAPASSGERVNTQLSAQWRKRNASQMKKIKDSIGGNLELQMLVLSTIESYQAGAKVAKSQSSTLAEAVSKRMKRDKVQVEADSDAESAEPLSITDWEKAIGRPRAMYSTWSKLWLCELLSYITDMKISMKMLLGLGSKARHCELLELALGIRCTGKFHDKIGDSSLQKGFVFDACKALYKKIGLHPLAGVAEGFIDGGIDWQKVGHYQLKVTPPATDQGGTVVVVACRATKQELRINPAVLQGDKGPFQLHCNWSLVESYILSPMDTYRLSDLWPSTPRQLRRRDTEELNLIAAVQGVEIAKSMAGSVRAKLIKTPCSGKKTRPGGSIGSPSPFKTPLSASKVTPKRVRDRSPPASLVQEES